MKKYNFKNLILIIVIFVFGCDKSTETPPNIVFILKSSDATNNEKTKNEMRTEAGF